MTTHPWHALREMPDVELRFTTDDELLQGADSWWYPERRLIVMDARLRQVSRRCALAHELAHIVREDGLCQTSRQESRQERAADRLAARWLIDLDQLTDALRWTRSPAEAAEELWVTLHLLRARLDGLHPAERGYIRRQLSEEGTA